MKVEVKVEEKINMKSTYLDFLLYQLTFRLRISTPTMYVRNGFVSQHTYSTRPLASYPGLTLAFASCSTNTVEGLVN